MKQLLVLGVCLAMVCPAMADTNWDTNYLEGTLSNGVAQAGDTTGNADIPGVGWNKDPAVSDGLWSFTLPSYGDLSVVMDHTYQAGVCDLDLRIWAYDEVTEMGHSLMSGDQEQVDLERLLPGTYYAHIDGWLGAGEYNVQYDYTEWVVPEVAVPSETDGYMESQEVDWYSFNLTETTEIDINTLLSTGITDTHIALYDAMGNVITVNDDAASGGTLSQILETLDAGKYFVAMCGYYAYFEDGFDAIGGNATGDYTLQILPEPASLVLLALGGLVGLRRRR